MKKIVYLSLLFVLISCANEKYKIEDFKFFTMDMPLDWQSSKQRGIDSEVFYLITKNQDTVLVEMGKYSISFDEVIVVNNVKDYHLFKSNDFPVRDMFFSDTPEVDENQGVFHHEFYYYDTINNKKAKLRIPKKNSIGRTSIRFTDFRGDESLTITATNLDSIMQKELVKSFYSIVFKL
ncbi:hypothetical protein [Flavobacterium sp. JP2137]|uniref:hypothetical protein n=1 Tax=Flavobacterium sp. JP2137 TaxID=3414510 RepID=UPI003D2FCDEC